MANPLVFTMPTFPHILELSSMFPRVLKLGPNLKTEVEYLKNRIKKEKPEIIIGFALAKGDKSYIEKTCFNEIHKKKILKSGSDSFELYVPDRLPPEIIPREDASRTFCNYVCYLLSEFLQSEGLKPKLSFYHMGTTRFELVTPRM